MKQIKYIHILYIWSVPICLWPFYPFENFNLSKKNPYPKMYIVYDL